jgi:hypothetical protein
MITNTSVLSPLAGTLLRAEPMRSMIVLKRKWSAGMQAILTRSHLKKVFWPKLGVGRSYQILEIPVYSSGLIFAAALILNQNPFFEIASSVLEIGNHLNAKHQILKTKHRETRSEIHV